MKTLMLLMTLVLLMGCVSTSGETEYTLTPIVTDNGDTICCEATVYNTKDYQTLKFNFQKNADGSISVSLDEAGVSASDPAMVQAENNAKLLDAVTKILPTNGGG